MACKNCVTIDGFTRQHTLCSGTCMDKPEPKILFHTETKLSIDGCHSLEEARERVADDVSRQLNEVRGFLKRRGIDGKEIERIIADLLPYNQSAGSA